jgi:hypothetical protein
VTVARYQQKRYELPSEGTYRARLIDIKDLDPALTPGGEEKPRVRFIWDLRDALDSRGVAMKAFQTFNLTMYPMGFLSRAIADITGKDPGREFDLDTLLGVEVDLVIKHNRGADGKTYANVARIIRPKTRAEEVEEQRVKAATTRVLDEGRKPHRVTSERAESVDNGTEITNSDIPF